MMKIRFGKIQHAWVFVLAFCFVTVTRGDVRRTQAWTSDRIMSRFQAIPLDLQPTLPPPRLSREPEFTWGLNNTLYWSIDSVTTMLKPLGATLLFFEIQASYNNQELWGFVGADVDSARFTDLPEGMSIEYRLRYYAQNTSGTYLLSQWSQPQTSIQDNHPPVLEQWDIVGMQKTLSGNWVIGRDISVHLKAEDKNGGKIMEAVLREMGPSLDSTRVYDFQHPKASIDTTLSYRILESENRITELRILVKDVSGRPSASSSISFFWWSSDAQDNRMVCFPNPFNPDRGQLSTIKLDRPGSVETRILDPFGNLVRVLHKQNDQLFFEWDGKNEHGETVSNGAYLCVSKENQRLYCKIVVLK